MLLLPAAAANMNLNGYVWEFTSKNKWNYRALVVGVFFKLCPLISSQVMETKDMLYIVTEFAKNGEMFGKSSLTELTVP